MSSVFGVGNKSTIASWMANALAVSLFQTVVNYLATTRPPVEVAICNANDCLHRLVSFHRIFQDKFPKFFRRMILTGNNAIGLRNLTVNTVDGGGCVCLAACRSSFVVLSYTLWVGNNCKLTVITRQTFFYKPSSWWRLEILRHS
jgi:hypothetical protein